MFNLLTHNAVVNTEIFFYGYCIYSQKVHCKVTHSWARVMEVLTGEGSLFRKWRYFIDFVYKMFPSQ